MIRIGAIGLLPSDICVHGGSFILSDDYPTSVPLHLQSLVYPLPT